MCMWLMSTSLQAVFVCARPAYVDHALGDATAVLRFTAAPDAARALKIGPAHMHATLVTGVNTCPPLYFVMIPFLC